MDFLLWLICEGLFNLIAAWLASPPAAERSRREPPAHPRAAIHEVASPAGSSYREWEAIHRPPDPAALHPRAVPDFALRVGKGTRCLVCRETLDSDLVTCPDCATPHHRECWTYNRGCSTYGCRKAVRPRR